MGGHCQEEILTLLLSDQLPKGGIRAALFLSGAGVKPGERLRGWMPRSKIALRFAQKPLRSRYGSFGTLGSRDVGKSPQPPLEWP
jgi:hypothetical protein